MFVFVRVFLMISFGLGGLIGGTIVVTAVGCLILNWCQLVSNPVVGLFSALGIMGAGGAIVVVGCRRGERDKEPLWEQVRKMTI